MAGWVALPLVLERLWWCSAEVVAPGAVESPIGMRSVLLLMALLLLPFGGCHC